MYWTLIKDVLLTVTGMTVIGSQLFSLHPSDVLLVTGLALTVPSVAGHATALISGAARIAWLIAWALIAVVVVVTVIARGRW